MTVIAGVVLACAGPKRKSLVSPTNLDQLPSVVMGEQTKLLQHGQFGLTYFPDEGTALITRGPTWRLVLTALDSSYLVEGTDLQHQTSAPKILAPGKPGEFDNGHAGISAVYLRICGEVGHYAVPHGRAASDDTTSG